MRVDPKFREFLDRVYGKSYSYPTKTRLITKKLEGLWVINSKRIKMKKEDVFFE